MIETLPSTVVSLLAPCIPFLAKGTEEVVKKLGAEVGGRVVKLYDTLKARLTRPAAAEALADLEKQPEDADAQAAFRLQLKKALEADPALRDLLAGLVREIEAKGGPGVIQTATTIGDYNKTTQISGSGNTVVG